MNRYILHFFSLILVISIVFTGFIYRISTVNADQRLETTQAERDILQSEYDQLQKDMAVLDKKIGKTKEESANINRDISILKDKIKKAQLNIKSKNILIKKLGGEIVEKDKKINVLNSRINNIKESLSQLIRKDREIDDKSILSLILSKNTISEAYGDIDAFSTIKKSINDQVNEIRGVRALTEEEKLKLEQTKNKETDTKVQMETAKKEVEVNEKEQKKYLDIKNNEIKEYQKIQEQKAKRRAEILAILFNLRDASAIPFGKALEYANLAEQKTGVAPAFILAILSRESNLGEYQGSCYVTNLKTGSGTKNGKSINNVMKPMGLTGRKGDIDDFIKITAEVGRDPMSTLVSCPFSYGYGGAMGPSQIIPTTWQGLKSKVASYLGTKTPDPWYARDAIMATGVYLAQKGASGDSFTSQRTAACNYYAGSGGCPVITKKSTKQQIDTTAYGNWVMNKTKVIQETMIDPLQN